MASEEEEIRRLMEADARVKNLGTSLNQLKAATMAQVEAARAAGASQAQLNTIWAQSLPQITNQTRALNAAQKELATSTRNMGYAMMFAGNSMQDFQAAGLRGILNNIPQVITALGGSAGLAGVVTIAAVAFEQFRPQIEKLMETMDPNRMDRFTSSFEKLRNQVEELHKAGPLSAADAFGLETSERRLAAYEKGLTSDRREMGRHTPTERDTGRGVGNALDESPQWRDAYEKIRASLVDQAGNDAAAAAHKQAMASESDIMSGGSAFNWRNVKSWATGDFRSGMALHLERARKKAEEASKKARGAAEKEQGSKLGELVDKAMAGDENAVKELAAKVRAAGNEAFAGWLEEQVVLAKLKAGTHTVPDLDKEGRLDRAAKEVEAWDEEDAQRQHSDNLWREKKAWRAEKDRKRMAAFDRARPDWNAETDEMALLRDMQMGRNVTEERDITFGAAPLGSQELTRRQNRWKTVWKDGRLVDQRTMHRAVSLEEASKQLEERRYEALVAQGVDRSTAREEAKKYGEKAYGAQMQRGYDAWRQLGEMQMTGQLGRGVQVMGSESYIDSVQTAREGIDKQMLDLMKKGVEAQVFLKEWARVNGVAARVARRKAP